MQVFLCEFLGTMMMILLGNGVVANVNLNKSGMQGAGALQITLAWGFAVMIPAYIFGASSGAHFNPAFTLALAAEGGLPWAMVPGYIVAQFLGAFCGACLVWAMFKDQFDATENPAVKFGCFATTPAIQNLPRNIFSEGVAAFVLVFAIKGIAQVQNITPGLSGLYLFGIICAVGMSLGGVTGYAINPARDLGPRLAYQLLPLQNKGSAHWGYAVVPVVGPVLGALAAVGVYHLVF